jgi:hypothetical protein
MGQPGAGRDGKDHAARQLFVGLDPESYFDLTYQNDVITM